jgi:hypothetical protein
VDVVEEGVESCFGGVDDGAAGGVWKGGHGGDWALVGGLRAVDGEPGAVLAFVAGGFVFDLDVAHGLAASDEFGETLAFERVS